VKILYHHRIASKDGQYVHVEEIITALKENGHEVIVVAPDVAENSEFGSDGGFVDVLKSKMPQALYELLEITYSIWAFLKLSVAILKHKPDAIYERYNLFLPAGIWAKKIFNLPMLLEVNAPIYEERKKYDGITLNALAKWSQRYCWLNADVILPVTDVLAEYARAVSVPESQILVIPNGINHKRFSDAEVVPGSYDKNASLVIGFVGFVREWHGLDKVIELISEFDNIDIKLLIVGDGPAKRSLVAQAKSLGISDSLYITGVVNRDDMSMWLNVIDIALQPDVTSYASPLKMLEYMAKGKAIVAPDTPNIRELLSHEDNALLFKLGEQSSFISQIKRLTVDQALSIKLGLNATKTIDEKQLTWSHNARKIVTLIENLKQKNNL